MNTQLSTSPAASSPSLAVHVERPDTAPPTRVSLAYIERKFKLYLRFGEPAHTLRIDRWRRCAVFLPAAIFCRIRWQANAYGTVRWQLMVMQAGTSLDVLTRLPPDAAALAAQRGYLPTHIPLLKRVGAIAPQHVCIVDGYVHIDGMPVAAVLPADRLDRPLPVWPQCRRLQFGELFLLSTTHPASFDSRYFGPVNASAVIGIAHPVWVETRP